MPGAALDPSLVALLAAVTVTDLRSRLIPDRFLAAGTVLGLAVVLLWDPGSLVPRLAAAAGAGGFLLAAALLRPGDMGLGDVKLAAVLGLYLGGAVVPALLVALSAGFLAGIVMVIRGGWEARARTIPFAPFLAAGAVAAMAAAQP